MSLVSRLNWVARLFSCDRRAIQQSQSRGKKRGFRFRAIGSKPLNLRDNLINFLMQHLQHDKTLRYEFG
jgi:hypothetical protein